MATFSCENHDPDGVCDPFFNIYNLSGASMETEIGWTPRCIENRVKGAIFICILVWSVLLFFISGTLALREWKDSRMWNLRLKVFIFVFLGAIAEIVSISLFMAGIQSRARFLVSPLLAVSANMSSALIITVWVKAFSGVVKSAQQDPLIMATQRITFIIFGVGSVAMIIFHTVLPMIVYEDHILLNWFHTLSMCCYGLTGVFGCLVFGVVTYRLRCLSIEAHKLTGNLSGIILKLTINVVLTGIFGTLLISVSLFPLWHGLFAVCGDPYIKGRFYVHFVYFLPNLLASCSSSLWIVLKAPKSRSQMQSGGSHQSSSQNINNANNNANNSNNSSNNSNTKPREKVEKEKDPYNFPTYSIEELQMSPA